MIIARETLQTFHKDAQRLIQRHWEEISSYPDIPLDPHWEMYGKTEEAGILRIYTARLDSGTMIGYAMFIVSPGAHYRGSLQANEDVVFVDPVARGGMTGMRLLKFSDEQLKAEGVQVVYHHVKLKHPALGRLLEKIGYKPIETHYAKRLDI